ncbi:MAG: hypothetical protein ABIQ59_06165 [Nocardioidaceae bacterium]
MDIELLVVPDCPHEAGAAELLRTALDDVGLGASGVAVDVVHSQEEAEARYFVGSPTFCLDGADVFPEPDQPAALACRLYPGARGVPELRDLRQALKRAAAASMTR